MDVNFPNALALFRILMVVPIMSLTRADGIENHYAIAALLFLVASFTDFLDGYWARRTTGGTVLGALWCFLPWGPGRPSGVVDAPDGRHSVFP